MYKHLSNIEFWVSGAMLMAMYLNDLNEDETLFLTEAFIKSGNILFI